MKDINGNRPEVIETVLQLPGNLPLIEIKDKIGSMRHFELCQRYNCFPSNSVLRPDAIPNDIIDDLPLINFDSPTWRGPLGEDGREDYSKIPPISESQIRELLKTGRVPKFFLQRINAVEYKGETNSEVTKTHFPGNPDTQIGGLCIREYSDNLEPTNRIMLFAFPEHRIMHVPGTENIYMELLSHELGHNAHALLSAEELERWETTAHQESEEKKRIGLFSDVSEYVARARGYIGVDEGREDFAESFRLFVMSPGFLLQAFPKRYNMMLRIFRDHMASDEEWNQFYIEHQRLISVYQSSELLTADRKIVEIGEIVSIPKIEASNLDTYED